MLGSLLVTQGVTSIRVGWRRNIALATPHMPITSRKVDAVLTKERWFLCTRVGVHESSYEPSFVAYTAL